MGYRTNINDGITDYYNAKHYGYSAIDEHELPSYKYLVEIGVFDGTEIFWYGCDNEIELTPEQFRHFITLYSEEYAKSRHGYNMMEDPEIIALYESENNKLIQWF